jgi:trehalose 6-phosphate synthase
VTPGSKGRGPEVLVASNRGPYIYERARGGLTAKRGPGGLIGSLAPVLEDLGGCWIAAALGEGDREFVRLHPHGREEGGFHLRLLDIPTELHRQHYEIVSNEYLWFLFHYLFDTPSEPVFDDTFASAWSAYRDVNRIYAEAALATHAQAVLFEDYHLMLAGGMVRRQSRAKRPLLYFHHTPWCGPEYFSILPDPIRTEILESMLAYDVVGFHATRWAEAFALCCERYVPKARRDGDTIEFGRRRTKLLVAPVPIDHERLAAQAHDDTTSAWVEKHDERRAGRHLLLRVDRIDLSKNALRGFLAFEQLLERQPQLCSEVLFLALLYPSRLSVERYKRYYTDCLGIVRRINERYEAKVDADTGPVHLVFEDDFARSLGAMRIADTVLVNPVWDGLNLVCKEVPAVNERSGSVILSRNAGAFEEIGDATIAVDPFDVSQTADAIDRALVMGDDERARRARKLKRIVTRSTPKDWLRAQLAAAGL